MGGSLRAPTGALARLPAAGPESRDAPNDEQPGQNAIPPARAKWRRCRAWWNAHSFAASRRAA